MAIGVMLAVLLITAVLAAIASFMLYTDKFTVARILQCASCLAASPAGQLTRRSSLWSPYSDAKAKDIPDSRNNPECSVRGRVEKET
jgi:hypothetical protein